MQSNIIICAGPAWTGTANYNQSNLGCFWWEEKYRLLANSLSSSNWNKKKYEIQVDWKSSKGMRHEDDIYNACDTGDGEQLDI